MSENQLTFTRGVEKLRLHLGGELKYFFLNKLYEGRLKVFRGARDCLCLSLAILHYVNC